MARVLLAAALLLAASLACADAQGGPGELHVTVESFNFTAFPPVAAKYINATYELLKAINASDYLLYPALPPSASMQYSKTATTVRIVVTLVDPTGVSIKQLASNLRGTAVTFFVRKAGLTGSGARIKVQAENSSQQPTGGHSFTCGADGPYVVGLLCVSGPGNRPPRPPPTPKSPPKPPRVHSPRRLL